MGDAAAAHLAHVRGDLSEAAGLYERAMLTSPDDPVLHRDYAALLMQLGRHADAVPVLRHAVSLSGAPADTALALAVCLRATGNLVEAAHAAGLAITHLPDEVAPWLVRGTSLLRIHDLSRAEHALRQCLSIDDRCLEAWHYLGEACQAQGRWREAIDCYRMVEAKHPGEITNIGQCATQLGDQPLALACFERMCALHPRRVDARVRLAHAQAVSCLLTDQATTLERLLVRLQEGPPTEGDLPDPFALASSGLTERHKHHLLQRHAALIESAVPAVPPRRRESRSRIRVGYLSADFGEHAVGQLVRSLFRAHDRTAFEVYGYGLLDHADEVGMEIKAGFDVFVDLSTANDPEATRIIASADLDVLVDLGGYTAGARPKVLAGRPAPLQLGWLGFIHGQNAPWLDGILLDRNASTMIDWPYSDRIIQLDCPLLPLATPSQPVPDRNRFGFPDDAIVFASFNNAYKIDHPLLSAWVSILDGVENSVLALLLEPHARAGFLRAWAEHGGDPVRLHLLDRLPFDAQQDRAASCDLFLDAFRYNAGATAVSVLSAGLPLLSVQGSTPLSRMSASLNLDLGLSELVCSDAEDYVRTAVALGNAPSSLNAIRLRLDAQRRSSRCFDIRRTASTLESVFRILAV